MTDLKVEPVRTTVGEFEVVVNTWLQQGSFEWVGGTNEDEELAGGLWFKDDLLIDYDGVFELPKEVIEGLTLLGFRTEDGETNV